MTIQFTNYTNKQITWTDELAIEKLSNITLARKNRIIVHTDLSISHLSTFSQIIWDISSLLPCIRNWIFDTDLHYSIEVLKQLKPQIETKEEHLITIFKQALNLLTNFTSNLSEEVKEPLLISPQSTIQNENTLDNQLSLFESRDSLDLQISKSTKVSKKVLWGLQNYNQWQIGSTKVSFSRKNLPVDSTQQVSVSFKSAPRYYFDLNQADKTFTFFLKNGFSNHLIQFSTALNKALTESKLHERKITLYLPSRGVSQLNIENMACTIASDLKEYIEENPNDYDEINLISPNQKISDYMSYSTHFNKIFA
jgi:hypothetical protein